VIGPEHIVAAFIAGFVLGPLVLLGIVAWSGKHREPRA
jgi:hypothetical protein